MSTTLSRFRILVADDQLDVARTLCRTLQSHGALFTFVSDGQQAYARVDAEPYDLLIVDMKMPPGEWGGLWLLKELRDRGWRLPVLVLSGEGTKRQAIEALRSGAIDWIDKSSAGEELEERCIIALDHAVRDGLEHAAANLPTPLAQRLAAYSRQMGTEWQGIEGLRTLEAILRFIAILGLSTTKPFPLPAISKQIAKPSMGTWFAICGAVAEAPNAGKSFLRLSSCLMPDRKHRAQVQDQLRVRNAMAHSGYSPTVAEVARLHDLLTRFAHRANSSWRSTLAVPTSMTYDGAVFAISVLSLVGTSLPRNETLASATQIRTGQPILIGPESQTKSTIPWLITTSPRPSEMQCLFFDGVHLRNPGRYEPESPLVYMNPHTGENGIQAAELGGLTYSEIRRWISVNSED